MLLCLNWYGLYHLKTLIMSIENLNKNDLLILEESYKVETELEKDALIELLFDKNKKLVEQINTLKHLNNELIGFVKKI